MNWLDPEDVKATLSKILQNKQTAALEVLKAIAALPEPRCLMCDQSGVKLTARHDPDDEQWDHVYVESVDVYQIWAVAKLVTE